MPDRPSERGSTYEAKEASTSSPLDNPIWGSLTTDHAHFAQGKDGARRYPAEIGPLGGMPTQSIAGYQAMRPLAGPQDFVAFFFQAPPRLPAGWVLVRGGVIHQMVAERPALSQKVLSDDVELRRLTPADVPAMVELARLTEPGPFGSRTIELGAFFGVMQSGRLLAMAGQRLRVPGFIEVSAVCTHPDARGRGYASLLMSRVMEEIVRAGRTPFLHTFADNRNAIRIYESLGFTLRRSFELAVLRREA